MIVLLFVVVESLKALLRRGDAAATIVWLGQNFVVANKRYDMLLNSNDPKRPTVQHFLVHKYPHLVNSSLQHGFHFVHRLDFATSGVHCVALNKEASRVASAAFLNREAQKFYLALVRGHVSEELLSIEVAIGEENAIKMTSSAAKGLHMRQAATKMLLLELGLYDNYPASKVLLRPITGRRHQLRVHCSYLGHTIVGDYTYSNRRDVKPYRMYLHAIRLVLPNSLEPLDVSCDDPFSGDWSPVVVLNRLDRDSYEKLR